MIHTNTVTLAQLKNYLSYHPFIKYNILKVNVNFPPRGTPIGIVAKYCEYNHMSYIYHSTNNSPCNHEFPDKNRTNIWILITDIK